MKKQKETQRKHIIGFRVDDEEKEIFNNWAKKNHIGLAPLIRFKCLKLIDKENEVAQK